MAEITAQSTASLDSRSLELRRTIVRMFDHSKRGHVGSSFSLVEILRVLYDDILRYDAKHPSWPNRDRFILSKGHGCPALFTMLSEKGFFPESELWKFCQSDGILGGHPEHKVPGVEASTGSLGHGLSIGLGMALNARYEKSGARTYVIIGDGESNEGSIWEAAMSAGKHRLTDLTVMVDYNKHQSYGSTFEIQDLEPLADKWRAFGFATAEVDGHSVDELRNVLSSGPLSSEKPSVIICHTVKGRGASFAENNMDWHHKSRISDEEISSLMNELEG
jgi:transketolase